MAQLLASYTVAGRRHRIELVPQGRQRLLIDRPADGPARLVAELAPDEGEQQALAVLYGEGAYLERARAGEPGLCRWLDSDDPPGQRPLARAA
jgi:hypothetical protein